MKLNPLALLNLRFILLQSIKAGAVFAASTSAPLSPAIQMRDSLRAAS